jgi:hypothetical protein
LILHRLTLADPLDFFVLFSSVAALFGSPGQANHAAANAFLDALASARQAEGLPGLSINWGAWGGAGAAVDRGVTARAEEAGYGVIDAPRGFRALETLLESGLAQAAVLPANWPRLLRKLSREGRPPLFLSQIGGRLSTLQPAASEDRPQGGGTGTAAVQRARPAADAVPFGERLAAAAPNQRRAMVLDQVRQNAARVLGLGGSAVPGNKPLNEMGLDSLMAVELRNSVGLVVGRNLPPTLLFDYPTLEALTEYLCRTVLGLEEGLPASAEPRTEDAESDPLEMLARIETLEEDEIDRLLRRKEGGNE